MKNGGTKMAQRKKIAICATSLHQKSVHRTMSELGSEAAKRGYDVQIFASLSDLYHHSENEHAQSQIFELNPYDKICALILFSETILDENLRNRLAKHAIQKGIPVFSHKLFISGCYYFHYNSENALADILRHLIEIHHCKRINFITGIKGNNVTERRTQIYRETLQEYGYPVEEGRIGYGDFWGEPAKAATEAFLMSDLPLPDAIVCANDAMAIGVTDYLAEKGIRVPKDMIVTGLGGIEARQYHLPLLTTAIYDASLSSTYFMDTLDALMENSKIVPSSIAIPCKNVYTESCGCIEHDTHEAEKHLMQTYLQLERERQYSHATHDFVNSINAEGTFSALIDGLPNYLWGPQVTEYNLYLDAAFALSGKWENKNITERQFILFHQKKKQCSQITKLLRYQEYTEQERNLYEESHQVLTIPLNVEGHVYGIFSINYQGTQINHECLYELIMTLNSALHSIHSQKDLLRVSRQLNELSEQTIQSLAEIVEAKSEFTGLHVKRVSEYTRILAEAMGYSPEKVNIIRIASMMHDIGKINIPSSILEKPGKLTDEEFEIIKGHVTDGGKMLQNASGEIMETAYKIALQHHEKWNGTGYLGMAGEEIALESRIVALADVFDALVSKRPYKKPFTAQRALEIITQDSGTHFDPQVVNAFRSRFDRFLQVLASYKDQEEAI